MNVVEKAVNDLKQGKFIVILDDEREKEADLAIAAKYADEKNLIFLLKHCSGMVCVPIDYYKLKEMGLKLMVEDPTRKDGCSFTESVDSIDAKTGIGAEDKASTIYNLIYGYSSKLIKPGHTFPLIAKPWGVLERQGHTEASLDLVKLAKIYPSGAVISEIMDREKGEPLRGKSLEEFASTLNLTMINIKDVFMYRIKYLPEEI